MELRLKLRRAARESTVGIVLWATLAGCFPSDTLEETRQRQAVGDYEGSIEPLRELLAKDRDDTEVNYLYGRALALTGQMGMAEWSLRKAMEDPEWLVPAGLQLAHTELAVHNYAAAVDSTTRVLEADPENVEALMMRANAYTYSRMNHEEALLDVERVLELDPDNLEVLRPRVHALLGLDRIDETAEALEELGQRIDEALMGSDLPGWHCSISAIFAEESEEMELAAERWADCVERYPGHASVVRNGVTFYDGRGDFDRSLEILRDAYAEQPDSRQYRAQLAERLRSMDRAAEGEAVLREATESDVPQIAGTAWIDLAKLLQSDEKWAEAADAAGEAVRLSREVGQPPVMMLFQYADALLLADRLEEALAIADEIPLAAYRESVLARVAQKREHHAEALAHFDEAFRVWPDNPWARYHAALSAEALGDFDRAVEEYRYSIRIASDATDSRLRLARLHLAEGRPREALQMLFLNQPGERGLDPGAQLLALELWAQIGMEKSLGNSLAGLAERRPGDFGEGIVSAARGLHARSGPEAAIVLMRAAVSGGLDLSDPSQSEVLERLVRYSIEAGRADEGAAELEAALDARPDVAAFHAVRGLWLEGTGAGREEQRAAYARGVELDPNNSLALKGLASLALEDDPERALELFQRAAAADPEDSAAVQGESLALLAVGRPGDAEERLNAYLAREPYSAEVAAMLVQLHLARGVATEETLERARRSTRFGRSPGAYRLLAQVHQKRNEPELARQAEAHALALAAPREG